jgi:hypothetical protein
VEAPLRTSEDGKEVFVFLSGSVRAQQQGAGDRHHGASPNSGFAYLAITPTQKGKTIWLEPVSDKNYNSAK